MKNKVLVVGHADADGHLIAEQVRRNLSLIKCFDVAVVVDPDRTRDHRAWTKLDALKEIEEADIVFFVDMMFASSSFAEEAEALVEFVNRRKSKQFYLMDHHPLPLRRLDGADNLRVVYRPDVFDCAIGPRSGMMVVAAILEGQGDQVAEVRTPVHNVLAIGMRRAAALGGKLPGAKLLALLKADCWKPIVALGQEDRELHRLPRGRRPANQPKSKALDSLDKTATMLIRDGGKSVQQRGKKNERSTAMAYDIADLAQERFSNEAGRRSRINNFQAQARDLETIVTLLEVAAISLTSSADATFTRSQLIQAAREICKSQIDLRDEDIDIVLKKQSFLKRDGKLLRLR